MDRFWSLMILVAYLPVFLADRFTGCIGPVPSD